MTKETVMKKLTEREIRCELYIIKRKMVTANALNYEHLVHQEVKFQQLLKDCLAEKA
jgi:hypothetical protein